MPGGHYDPTLLAVLRTRTIAAIESLRAVTSDEPAAWDAVLAARVTREHLEQTWMPLIDRVMRSEAMVSWPDSGLGGTAAGLLGAVTRPSVSPGGAARTSQELGVALARMARDVIAAAGTEELLELTLALVVSAHDLVAMRALFTELGGTDTARLLMELGVADPYRDAEVARSLAIVVRDVLARATQGQGVPPTFVAEMVDGFVAGYGDMRLNPPETVSFVFAEVGYRGSFLVAATKTIVDHERAARNAASGPEDQPWPAVIWSSRLTATLSDVVDSTRTSPQARAGDPLYTLLDALAHDADAARAVFTDPDVARYLLAERRFDLDGLVRVSAAAEVAAAGPDVVPDAPAGLLHDAAVVASAFVNHMGRRVGLLDDPSAAVSASAAAILGRHLFAVHKEVLVPEALREPATMPRDLDAFGPDVVVEAALFDADALTAVTDLAVDDERGLATLRAALDRYEQGYAAAAAAASTRLPPADATPFLAGVIRQIGRLEGYLVEHAGHRAEAAGRDRDQAIGRWVDLGSTVVSAGLAKLPVPVVGDGLDRAAGTVEERWATHEASAEREFAEYADSATRRLRYVWYRELFAAGAITPNLPSAALASDGGLVTWDEFQALADADRRLVQDRMEENVWRGRTDIDGTLVTDAIKAAQQDTYAGLE